MDEIYANVVVKPNTYDTGGHIFFVDVIGPKGKLAYKRGWRPTSEWAAAAARRASKRMVRNEKRRIKRDKDGHIKEFSVKG